jgi:transposase-like protein
MEHVGLMVSDGLAGLDTALSVVYPKAQLQRCVTHLKRNMLSKVRHGDKMALAEDLRDVFRTGQRDYTLDEAWERWTGLCEGWGKDYRSIKKMAGDISYKYYFTYLQYHPAIQSMIYTTNWIERLNRDFRRVLRMRGAMPNEESVLVLMGKVSMDKEAYNRELPGIDKDETLFPKEKACFTHP